MLVRRTPEPAARAAYAGEGWQASSGKPKGKWQLVLLDHGLYRQLDDSFRLEYAGLWHSLVFAGGWALRGDCSAEYAGTAVLGLPAAAPPAPAFPLRRAADEAGIRRHSEAMNAGGGVQLFVGMLTQRPWEEVTKKNQVGPGVGVVGRRARVRPAAWKQPGATARLALPLLPRYLPLQRP